MYKAGGILRIKNNHYKRHFYFSYRKDLFLPRFMIDFRNIVQQVSQFEVEERLPWILGAYTKAKNGP